MLMTGDVAFLSGAAAFLKSTIPCSEQTHIVADRIYLIDLNDVVVAKVLLELATKNRD